MIDINFDKIITFFVTLVIIGYIVILIVKDIDFTNAREIINEVNSEIQTYDIKLFLENNDNYYYKIEGATYCITYDELKNSNEISDKTLDKINNHTIEAKFQNGDFEIQINDECIEK